MRQSIAAGLAGLVFGLGLVISGMINPAKVLGFLTLDASWDPSLALVMAGALAVVAIGYRLVWRRGRPLLDNQFHLPANRRIDRALLAGAALFGLGWGLAGLCPGPAIAAAVIGGAKLLAFLAAMLAGMAVTRWLQARL